MTDTTKRIVYIDPDEGCVVVICPAPNCDLTIEQLQAKDVPVGVTTSWIVNKSDVPTDRTFRDAWTFTP